MKTPILETTRLLLRPPSIADAEDVFQSYASDDDVSRYVTWSTHESVDVTKKWLATEEKRIESDTYFQWVFIHKETGELIGAGGFGLKEDRGMHEIGYVLMKKYWNQGFTTEAVKAILDFAINTLGIKTFFARHAVDNPASGRVMEKVGFVYHCEGTCECLDGVSVFDSKEYILSVP